jgi:hypothetical protein
MAYFGEWIQPMYDRAPRTEHEVVDASFVICKLQSLGNFLAMGLKRPHVRVRSKAVSKVEFSEAFPYSEVIRDVLEPGEI